MHELVEMNSEFCPTRNGICLGKHIHQHGLATANLTMQIYSTRLLGRASKESHQWAESPGLVLGSLVQIDLESLDDPEL